MTTAEIITNEGSTDSSVALTTRTADGDLTVSNNLSAPLKVMSPAAFQAAAKAAAQVTKETPMAVFSSDYWEATKTGDKSYGIFIGMTFLNITDPSTGEVKARPAVQWIDNNGQLLINAGVALVRNFYRPIEEFGDPALIVVPGTQISIELKEMKSASVGKVKIYQVNVGEIVRIEGLTPEELPF